MARPRPTMLDKPFKDLASWTDYVAHQDLPVLRRTAARLGALARGERDEGLEVDARLVAEAIGDDALMALRLFSHVARRRAGHADAEVATVERAVLMLGVAPFFRAFGDPDTVEARLCADARAHAGLVRVLRRAQRASRMALDFAVWRNDVNAEEIALAALLHDLAEMLMWCFAPALMLRIAGLQSRDPALRSGTAQREVLNIELNELQVALAHRWRLPALLAALMDDRHAEAPRVRNVLLAVRIARHSARTWGNPALPDDYRELAVLLSVSPGKAAALAGAPEPAAGASPAP